MALLFGRWLCSCHPSLDLEQDEVSGKTTQTVTLEQEISNRLSASVEASRADDGAREASLGLTIRF